MSVPRDRVPALPTHCPTFHEGGPSEHTAEATISASASGHRERPARTQSLPDSNKAQMAPPRYRQGSNACPATEGGPYPPVPHWGTEGGCCSPTFQFPHHSPLRPVSLAMQGQGPGDRKERGPGGGAGRSMGMCLWPHSPGHILCPQLKGPDRGVCLGCAQPPTPQAPLLPSPSAL